MKASLGLVTFRVINQSDDGFLRRLYASTRAQELKHSGWPEIQKQTFLDSQYMFQKRAYHLNFLGAVHRIIQLGGVDIGRLIVNETDDELRIIDFSLLPEYRGKGIGTDILRSLINKAEGGKVPVRLMAVKNSPAINLYLRHGFKKTGVSENRYTLERPVDMRAAEI